MRAMLEQPQSSVRSMVCRDSQVLHNSVQNGEAKNEIHIELDIGCHSLCSPDVLFVTRSESNNSVENIKLNNQRGAYSQKLEINCDVCERIL